MSVERNTWKEIGREVINNAVFAFIIAIVIGLAVLLVLSPGIIINGLRGHYKDRGSQNLIWAACKDGETWLISLAFAATAFILLSLFGAFRAHTPVVDTRNSLPQPVSDVRPESPDRPVVTRRAIAVTQPSPTSDQSSTDPVPSSVQPTASQVLYWVVEVGTGGTLNVRLGPGARYPTIERLSNGFDGIQIVGPTVMNEATEWVKIALGEKTGWVNKQYLKPK
jgi:hypothetical protein